ncbi:MAG: hypothetical protein Q8891_11375 [Bacteroidota bacterium]|nr:hypothetical protein [Bacteroidota bacterium]
MFVFIQAASRQSVEEIIDNYIAARGGIDKFRSIISISMEGTRKMMDNEVRVKIIKVQGRLFRTDFEFGGNRGYTIITPGKGWAYFSGHADGPQPLLAEKLKSMQTELNIGDPLVDYQLNGYQAVLHKNEILNGRKCHKIQLISADSRENFYYIDAKTNLLAQSSHLVEGNGQNSGKEVITNYSDYVDFGGVLFPKTIVTESDGLDSGSITFDKIETNISVDEKMYKYFD